MPVPPRVRFDRNELAGSFGDIGTDLPLLIGMILAADLDAASVFIVFGAMQMLSGLIYGLPMPMQPLKAMAVIVITNKVAASTLYGGGLAIGILMLMLTLSGGLTLLARWIPACVVRGVQLGLGLSLAGLALRDYVPSGGAVGWAMAVAGALVMIALWGNRRVPPGLIVIGIGIVAALLGGFDFAALGAHLGVALPSPTAPSLDDMLAGLLLLALPQLPLSISNSVIATQKTASDLFRKRPVTVRRLGITYAVANLIAPFLGGVPVCHGCGGLAGHHAFGARTGGSVVIYGALYLVPGVLLGSAAHEALGLFPKPILGVVLLFEALALMALLRDQASSSRNFSIAVLVGIVAMTVPQGFLVGLLLGTLVFYAFKRFGRDA